MMAPTNPSGECAARSLVLGSRMCQRFELTVAFGSMDAPTDSTPRGTERRTLLRAWLLRGTLVQVVRQVWLDGLWHTGELWHTGDGLDSPMIPATKRAPARRRHDLHVQAALILHALGSSQKLHVELRWNLGIAIDGHLRDRRPLRSARRLLASRRDLRCRGSAAHDRGSM